jgi:excisionase family DNA binding protein
MEAALRPTSRTFLPEDTELSATRELFEQLESDLEATGRTTLISGSGRTYELPPQLFDVLRFVGVNLANGLGVTVIPSEAKLTTQQAADFLGISRPTLIKLLDSGKIEHTLVGRHRRVALVDLESYQRTERARRRTVLAQAARNNQDSGMLDLGMMDEN